MKKIILLSSITCALLYADSALMYKTIQSNITVVGEGKIKQENADNLSQMLDSENGIKIDDDTLSIRGVGDNGRGISVVDNGVSETDVAGVFTFDIDTSELEKLIVYKGPGSIYSVNGTGGVVKANSKPVFKTTNNIKIGYGSYGHKFLKANLKHYINLDNVLNVTYTKKDSDNDYKEHSRKESDKFAIKYGRFIDDTSSIEIGYKYSDTKSDKIQFINESDFETFKDGNTIENDGIWIYNKNDNKIKTTDLKYKKYFGDDMLRVGSFYKTMDRVQYQDGKIKIFNDNYNAGIDTEYEMSRGNSEYLFGISYKKDMTKNNNQYKYDDITLKGGANNVKFDIVNVNSKTIGDILSSANSDNNLIGIYAKDAIKLNKKIKFELSMRVDRINFDVDNSVYEKYQLNSNSGDYLYKDITDTYEQVSKKTTLHTYRTALIFALNKSTNLHASIAHGEQTMTDTQLLVNMQNDMSTDLKPEKATNYEVGIKHSSNSILIGLSTYKTYLTDEIVEYKDQNAGVKYYESAGKTEKEGIELSLKYNINDNYYVGTNYTYSNYKYIEYNAWDASSVSNVDYSGNYMENTPQNKYALFAGLKDKKNKLSAKAELISSGSYYTDKANTTKYNGYSFVTNVMAGWEPKSSHKLMLNVNNLFDKRYASNVIATTDTLYTVAPPRSVIVSYKYSF
ncbi:MAG: TonB-dependent receptor [Campylobacterota bacterium]|nr:TonB-dependent receptor [Campylobacterota bacterium]